MKYAKTNKIIRVSLVVAWTFSAIFFGAVHVWAYTLVQLALVSLMLVFILVRVPGWWRSSSGEIRWIVTPLNWTAFAVLFIVLLQLIPLPEEFVRFLSPNTTLVLDKTKGTISGPVSAYHLSLYRNATATGLMMILACLCFYLFMIYSVKKRAQLNAIVKGMLSIGFVLCLYGIFEKLSGHNHILWWRHKWHAEGFRVFGTFVNPDHFGFFLNMIVFLFFGYVYSLVGSKKKNGGHKSKNVFRFFVDNVAGIQKVIFSCFCLGIMLLTLIMTGSRAAILSLGLSSCFIFAFLFVKTKRKGLFFLMGISFVVVFVYGQRMGIERILDRFEHLAKEQTLEKGRMLHNRAVLPIIEEYPIFGTGLGTFQYVYPRYQPGQDQRYRRFLHNDWLQLTLETGIAGFLVVFTGFIFLLLRYMRLWRKRNDPFVLGIGIGCIGAILASAIHSLFDFSLHMPANALTLTAVVAIGFLALHSKGHRSRKPFSYKVRKILMWGKRSDD